MRMKKILNILILEFLLSVFNLPLLLSRVLIVDDFNQPAQYNSNNLNDLGAWTDDDGTFAPGNTYDKVTNSYGRTNIKLNWTDAADYWYSVLNDTGMDVSSYDFISFKVRSTNIAGNINFRVVLRDANNSSAGKDTYSDLGYVIQTNWIIIQAQLSLFTGIDLTILKSVTFDQWGANSGKIFVDDIAICDAIVINNIDSTNLDSGETDETYYIGETVRIWITETSNFTGLNGTITISNTSGYKTNASLIDAGNGKYYFDWDTTGLSMGNYIIETTLGNNYVYDTDGYNDSGIDLLIQLNEKLNSRAMWVWDPSKEILYDWGYAREDLFDFCDAPPQGVVPVGIIYMHITPNELVSAQSYIKSFVSEAHNRGFKVYYLSGDVHWGQPDDQGVGTNTVNRIVDYNTNVATNERFDGVDFDIEVHNYSPPSGNWYDDPGAFGNYLNFLEYATNKFRKLKQQDPDFKFGVDIPYFYDTSPCTNQYKKVLDRVDYISLMDYKDTANLIYTLATNELAYATSINKKVRLGVETQNLGPALDGNTFYEEGWEYMENTLQTVRSNISSYPSFEREVIHYYDSYSTLKPYRIEVTKNDDIKNYGVLQGETNKTVMSIHITSDNNLTYLIGMKITNLGDAVGSDIPTIKVWKDSGTINNQWDESDIFIGTLKWDSTTSYWTNYRFTGTKHYLGFLGLDAVLTIDIATNAVGGRTFQAQISAGSILGSGRATGPSTEIINTGIQTIANISTNWTAIRINEILINAPSVNPPSDREPYWEWIELYNTSPNIVDLSGCLIGDTYPSNHYWKIPDGTLIDGYGFKVFYGYQFNPSLDTNNGVAFVNNNTSLTEQILFLDPYTNIVDSFDYAGANIDENDIYARKVDGFGPFYNDSTNISYNGPWVTSKTDNPVGTTNYYSTKGAPNATFMIICNSPSNKVPVNGSLNFTIKASNYLDNKIVTNYSGYNYVAFLSINGGGIIPAITTNGFTNGVWTGDIQFTDPGEFTLTAYYGGTIGNYSMITVYVPGSPPLSVSEIDIKQNPGYSPALSLYLNSLGGGKRFAVHIVGVDGQSLTQDATTVYIKASISDPVGINATLWETGTNTGVYTNMVILSTNSDDAYNIIKATNSGETIYAISAIGSLTDTFVLANTPLGLIDTYENYPFNECNATIHYEDDSPSEDYGSVSYDSNIFYSTFGETEGKSMRFDFNIAAGEYCWIENDVGGIDVTEYTSLNFMVRRGSDTGPNDCKVQISSMLSNDWQKVLIRDYVPGGAVTTNWQECNVPLSVFTKPFKGKLDNIAFVADSVAPSQGSLYIDNLRFLPSKATNLLFMSNNFMKVLVNTNVSIGATLYIQLEAKVMNSNTIDTTPVLLQSSSDTNGIRLVLQETGINTGIYRGIAYLGFNTVESNNTLGADWGDYIYLRSYDNTSLLDRLKVISSNERLRIIRISPTNNAKGISLTTKITATFNLPVLSSTVTDNFLVYDSESNLINYQSIDIIDGTNVVFTPIQPLDPNEFHIIFITTNIRDSVYGSFIEENTNSYFTTAPGWETFHYYNTINLNQNLADWIAGNCIDIHTNVYELLAEDVVFPSDGPPIIATHKLYVTWDTNIGSEPCYLYIGLVKNNNGNARDVWYDYIALDVTRDLSGATNFVDGSFTNNFWAYRRPEYIIKISHNSNEKYWNNIESFKWNGISWVAGPSMIDGTTNIPYTNSSIFELKIALTNLSPPLNSSDKIPNRVAILSWVHQDGYSKPLDYCQEDSRLLTFSPDNNGDDIPDGQRLAPTTLSLTKTYQITTNGVPSPALPGATVTFSIYYTNMGGDCIGVKIEDELQPGFSYLPGSLRVGASTDSYQTAQYYTDNSDDDLASFQLPSTITFVPSNGTAPSIGGWLPPNASGRCYFQATIDNLPAGTILSNVATVTGNIFPFTNSNKITITVVSTNAPLLILTKSISNIVLNSITSEVIPGCTIEYKIEYSNSGAGNASNVIIYDKISEDVVYKSNSATVPAGWSIEYSTNSNPNQSYNSSDYTTTEPSPNNIKWIRWKKSSVSSSEMGVITYKVIVK